MDESQIQFRRNSRVNAHEQIANGTLLIHIPMLQETCTGLVLLFNMQDVPQQMLQQDCKQNDVFGGGVQRLQLLRKRSQCLFNLECLQTLAAVCRQTSS